MIKTVVPPAEITRNWIVVRFPAELGIVEFVVKNVVGCLDVAKDVMLLAVGLVPSGMVSGQAPGMPDWES